VLIKDAAALERLERVTTVVVDKTGTLTEGKPSLQRAVPHAGFDERDLVSLAAAAEHASEHPLRYAAVMRHAAQMSAEYDCNIIQSNGAAATQTVAHLHVHIVPRTERDGLLLPWSIPNTARLPDDEFARIKNATMDVANIEAIRTRHEKRCSDDCNVRPVMRRYDEARAAALRWRYTEPRGR